MKKISSIILAMLMLLSIAACQKNPNTDVTSPSDQSQIDDENLETTEAKKEPKTPILAYYSNDSMNPFKATGYTNASLSGLYCQSLFVLNSDYSAETELAEGIVIEDDLVEVELKEDVRFSDGTLLDASDVAYSFRLAKESNIYSSRLSNFTDSIVSGNKITFRLKQKDLYAANCLDFPVVKRNSAEEEIVIGSGPFELKKQKGKYILKTNKHFSVDEKIDFSQIQLTNVSNVENELYLVQVGALTYVYDDFTKKRDNKQHLNASNMDISQNKLVYLGFNSKSEKISADVRMAIKLCLDRNELTRAGFDSDALTTYTVFNPLWESIQNLKFSQDKIDILKAQKLLEGEGYKYTKGLLYDAEGNFNINLLVCNADKKKVSLANKIKSSLEKCGFEVEMQIEDFDHYKKALSSGEYDIYVGEIKLTANMDLSCFFESNGAANYGIDLDGISATNYPLLRQGDMELNTYINIFNKDLPFLPICYKEGILYYSRELQFEDKVSENNLYKNIYTWDY